MCRSSFKLEISGLVQGVGFRPLVFNLATKKGLFGEVYNDTKGVVIILQCAKSECESFLSDLKANLPPLAKIEQIKMSECKSPVYSDFRISLSQTSVKTSAILSDFSFCDECEKEFYEPTNARFHYPFITCTHCGVRFSLIKKLPYDRKNTTMSEFKMCKHCQSEYENPKNRRFHAQPISCPKCAIKVSLQSADKSTLATDENAFKQAAMLLKRGEVLAMKGVGGFHLICDALNEKAIQKLRERKNRPAKPLAVLCKDLAQAHTLAHINDKEASLLSSNVKPIVLLKARIKLGQIAFDTDKIGIMLAYTPFQLLLFEYFQSPIIATSANLSGESIIYKEEDLFFKLNGVFDAFLGFEREIENPSDDSIAQVIDDEIMFLRTSRGISPAYIELDEHFSRKNALALGAELKNEFVISYDKKLIVSPYIGDLKSVDTRERFANSLEFFVRNYDLRFDALIGDKHPHFDYGDLKPNFKVQHHYAHLCATLFEHRIFDEVLAFAFDGTGYGDDGKIWGGEIFRADLARYERVGHFSEFKLINSDIKNIANLALSLIFEWNLQDESKDFLARFSPTKLENLAKIHAQSSLFTSSLGRITDAFGAVIFGKERLDYEAQMGLLIEKHFDENLAYSYKFDINENEICVKNAFKQALKDDTRHACTGFLNALAACIVDFTALFEKKRAQNSQKNGILASKNLPVILCGGVFQNSTLLKILNKKNFAHKVSLKFPPNDSCIALGQMAHFLYKQKN
mgnify:FL=1